MMVNERKNCRVAAYLNQRLEWTGGQPAYFIRVAVAARLTTIVSLQTRKLVRAKEIS